MQKRAYTHAKAAPETHLELHDRLADLREQPRRQRDQPRRELRVRRTGGDRRWRLPVPRQQHRHEQHEPLQQDTRSFAHARSSRKEHKGRRALPTAAHSALRAVPWQYSPRACHVSESRGVHAEYPAELGGRSARAPPSAVAGWPRLPWPAKPNGISKLQTPANKLRKKDCGAQRVHGDVQPTARCSVCKRGVLAGLWHGSAAALTGPWCAPGGGC